MNKTALTAIILLTLLIAVVAGTQVVEVAGAPTPHGTYSPGDPYTTIYVPTEIQPPNGTKPPIVTITSPINNTVIALDNLTLTFNLTLEASNSFYPITLEAVYYKPSWQPDNITLEIDSHSPFMKKTLPFAINITNIPEGTQSITVYAYTICEYETNREYDTAPIGQSGIMVGNYRYIYSNFYRIAGASSVNFNADFSPIITPSSAR